MGYLLLFVAVLYVVLSIVGGQKKTREKSKQDDPKRPSRRVTDESRSDIRPNESEVERQIRMFREQRERAMQSTSSARARRDSHASSEICPSVERKKTTAQTHSKPTVLPSATTSATTNNVMETSASFAERVAHTAPPTTSSTSAMVTSSTPSRLVVASDVAGMFRDRQSVARIFILNEILRRPW